jgi:ribosomal protein S3
MYLFIRGRTPFNDFFSNLDYSYDFVVTRYGCGGIKMWLFRDFFSEESNSIILMSNKLYYNIWFFF